MNYIYVVEGYVAMIVPARPLYELCDFVGGHKYHYYKEVPLIEPGFTRKFSLAKGWSDPINFNDIPASTIDHIKQVQKRLGVYHKLLDFENSCKLRYIPLGYGKELMFQLMEKDEALLETYAHVNGNTPEAVREELKLRKQEIANLFIFLLETRKNIIELLDSEKYDEALAFLKREVSRLNI